MTRRSVGVGSVVVVSLAAAIASVGRAAATEPGSFTDRVQKSLGIGAGSEERAVTGTSDSSTYGEPASFIARVERSQGVGHPPTVDREDQLNPEQIRLVQRSLAERGYAIDVTGRFDERTRSSLMSFQRSQDIPATGSLDARTVEALGFDPRQVTPVRGRAEGR